MTEHFHVDGDGDLVRTVSPGHSRVIGRPPAGTYVHRCSLEVLTAVAHAIDERAGASFSLFELVEATRLPHSQVNTALGFLKERGSVGPGSNRRRTVRYAQDVYLDAITEYHALREKGAVAEPAD